MSGCCQSTSCHLDRDTPTGKSIQRAWRRVLWVALALNGGMFAAEFVTGLAAESTSLQADALDFLGDAANYAVSLGVAGMALAWRARAALLKGWTLVVLGCWVVASAGWHAAMGTIPEARIMSIVGVLALFVNIAVAMMLYRYRVGDANMRSVWICSRNDAIGNLAVIAAALGVFSIGTGWPDIIVAGIMATLSITGGAQIVRQARAELRTEQSPATNVAPAG
jgi:Co/Zn/Cd efflux system component